ncbi:hypothetical protein BKA70DRAFT_1129908, partial [Coprinopsis sp. MPI-PUGE-AT-0042]
KLVPASAPTEVKPGDFCDKISAEQGVSSFQLANVNVGTINAACSNLFPGQIICLARTNLNCSPVAVVETGDTCTSLAAEAGITFSDILTNNPNVNPNCSNIFPGLVRQTCFFRGTDADDLHPGALRPAPLLPLPALGDRYHTYRKDVYYSCC